MQVGPLQSTVQSRHAAVHTHTSFTLVELIYQLGHKCSENTVQVYVSEVVSCLKMSFHQRLSQGEVISFSWRSMFSQKLTRMPLLTLEGQDIRNLEWYVLSDSKVLPGSNLLLLCIKWNKPTWTSCYQNRDHIFGQVCTHSISLQLDVYSFLRYGIWHGSNQDGYGSMEDCSSWTSSSPARVGRASISKSSTTLLQQSDVPCNRLMTILCVLAGQEHDTLVGFSFCTIYSNVISRYCMIDHAFSSSTTVLPTLTTGSESSLALYFSSPRRETIAIAASYTEALYRSK